MTPFDWLLLRRTAAAHGVALLVAAGVAAATDEVTSTLAMRLARLCAFSPFIGALCALGVTAHARSRGELLALESLGASPSRAGAGAALAALVFAAFAVAVLLTPWADATSLLPVVLSGADFRFDPDGSVARAAHVAVAADGRIGLIGAKASAAGIPPSGWMVIPCLAPVALLCPPWAASPMSKGTRVASLGLTGVSVLALLHLVAGARLPAVAGVVACGPLAVAVAVSRLHERVTRLH